MSPVLHSGQRAFRTISLLNPDGYICGCGTYIEFNNEELARKIASVYEVDLDKVVTKAPLKENVVESLVVVGDNVVVDVHKCCDNLMNVIDNRLPKQAKQSEKVSLAEA